MKEVDQNYSQLGRRRRDRYRFDLKAILRRLLHVEEGRATRDHTGGVVDMSIDVHYQLHIRLRWSRV